MTKTKHFTKVERGWYATEDGSIAIVQDGFDAVQSAGSSGDYEGFVGGEWALVTDDRCRLREDHNAGDNQDWFKTKRQAVEYAVRRYQLDKTGDR